MVGLCSPRSIPRSIPRSLPRSLPRSSLRSNPRSIPRSIPRSSPRSNPRSIPRSLPRSIPRSSQLFIGCTSICVSLCNFQRGQRARVGQQVARFTTVGQRSAPRAPNRKKPQRPVVRSLVDCVQNPQQPLAAWTVVPNVGHRRLSDGPVAALCAGFGCRAKVGR